MKQAHVIKKQRLNILVKDSTEVHEACEEIKELYYNDIIPEMELLFDSYSNYNEILTIDKIEIVIEANWHDDKGEFVKEVLDKLEEQLIWAMNSATLNNMQTGEEDYSKGDVEESKLFLSEYKLWSNFIFYIKNGFFDWNYNDSIEKFEAYCIENIKYISNQWRYLLAKQEDQVPHLTERLVKRFSDNFLLAFLASINPVLSQNLAEKYKAAKEVLRLASPTLLQRFGLIWWQEVLVKNITDPTNVTLYAIKLSFYELAKEQKLFLADELVLEQLAHLEEMFLSEIGVKQDSDSDQRKVRSDFSIIGQNVREEKKRILSEILVSATFGRLDKEFLNFMKKIFVDNNTTYDNVIEIWENTLEIFKKIYHDIHKNKNSERFIENLVSKTLDILNIKSISQEVESIQKVTEYKEALQLLLNFIAWILSNKFTKNIDILDETIVEMSLELERYDVSLFYENIDTFIEKKVTLLLNAVVELSSNSIVSDFFKNFHEIFNKVSYPPNADFNNKLFANNELSSLFSTVFPSLYPYATWTNKQFLFLSTHYMESVKWGEWSG